MSARKHHEIWIEQCEAARTIKTRYGLKAAFDYVVGEKLINFASAASQHPEFARELPRFVSEVRRMFTSEEIRTHLARLEREQSERAVDVSQEDELYPESPIAASERVRQFTTIKEFLTASFVNKRRISTLATMVVALSRLFGIDAPESGQPCLRPTGERWRCGQQASFALADRIGRGTVRCEPRDRDPCGQ